MGVNLHPLNLGGYELTGHLLVRKNAPARPEMAGPRLSTRNTGKKHPPARNSGPRESTPKYSQKKTEIPNMSVLRIFLVFARGNYSGFQNLGPVLFFFVCLFHGNSGSGHIASLQQVGACTTLVALSSLNRLNATLSLLHILDCYRKPIAMGSAIGRCYQCQKPLPERRHETQKN